MMKLNKTMTGGINQTVYSFSHPCAQI